MTHLSLFSGIGGLDLAAEWAGFETVGMCEIADYPFKILEKHWPDVPKWRDIHELTKESFFEKTNRRTVDVISGGCPCQPFSQAGKRRGKEDDRYLWPEMLRVITEIRPAWVVFENVPGIVNLALDTVLSDLEGAGYDSQTFIVPACGIDAPHRRERVCVVAHSVDRGGALRRDWKLQDVAEDGRGRDYHGRGTTADIAGERREDKSRTLGMVDGLRAAIYEADPHSDADGLQGRDLDTLLDATFTECSSRERERERERERDGQAEATTAC